MDMMGIISVCQWCSKRLLKGLFFATLPNMVSSVLCLNLMMMMMTKTRRQTSALMASFALCLRRRWPRWTRSWATSLRWSYPTKMDEFSEKFLTAFDTYKYKYKHMKGNRRSINENPQEDRHKHIEIQIQEKRREEASVRVLGKISSFVDRQKLGELVRQEDWR